MLGPATAKLLGDSTQRMNRPQVDAAQAPGCFTLAKPVLPTRTT